MRAAPVDSATDNLIQNGSFTETAATQIPNWNQLNNALPVSIGTEGTDTYITIAAANATSITGLEQPIPIHGEWAKILLRGDIRVVMHAAPVPSGADTPQASPFVGVSLSWIDKMGRTLQQQNVQSWLYTTPGWVEINELVTVPAGAAILMISPEVDDANAVAYIKDLNLSAWVSTFEDDFAGSTLDPSRWTVTTGKHNVSADEQQWFSPDEVTVAENMLHIRAEQKPAGGLPYTSGQIATIGKFQQLYGLYEFQLKLPVTDGAWPAAYLLAWNDDWPPEIDVEELAGDDTGEVLESNHYADDYGRRRGSNVNFSSQGIDRTQWHTYSVVWEPGEVAWYVDGSYKGTTGEPYDTVSDVPMYITINLAVGAFGGDPAQSTWPQDFYCKQVHVYQRSDLQLPLYPEDSQEITLPTNTATLSTIASNPAELIDKTWKLMDGPGPVEIRDSHSLTTTATFTDPGMYRFQIKVSSGDDTAVDQELVYVNPAVGGD